MKALASVCARSLLALSLALLTAPARAQVPLERVQEFLHASVARRGFMHGSLSAPAAFGSLEGARWVPVGGRSGAWRVADVDLSEWAARAGTWSPPLHLLMDRARSSIGLDRAVQRSLAGTGQGVVIGIVDAGVDAAHADLCNADGSTRIAWWLDFVSNPAGRHPELEAALGCQPQSGLRCQILDAADLNERLQNDVRGDEPTDPIGHGTHIASIAAGNGRASDGLLAGIAPEATLIVARVTGASGGIRESDVVLATDFVFQRAAELGMPAVVNLSLGGDFGAHDGSSSLAQALASQVGPDHPGRAIVVAAGNSGQLVRGLTNPEAEPLGIHAEVQLTPGVPQRVALLTPPPSNGATEADASIFIWLNLFGATELSLGLVLPDGAQLGPIDFGRSETRSSGGVTAAVVHGWPGSGVPPNVERDLPDLALGDLLPTAGSSVILIDGRWPAAGTFGVLLEGRGRAEMWAQSEGDLAPEASPIGGVFANASAQQTITMPASDPALLAVGASVNRLDWADYRAQVVSPSLPFDATARVGAAAFFSSAGPNRLGDIKPDLLAPGGFVVAALAAAADPRSGGRGVFAGLCLPIGCQVVSSDYAVTAGTSMAAPMVTGAVALAFERAPNLTQPELRALLQAGSDALLDAEPKPREGGGVLNIERSLAALSSVAAPQGQPDLAQSRLRFASEFVVADAARSLAARLWLRDSKGEVLDLDPGRLTLQIRGGVLAASLARVGPGLYGFSLSVPAPASVDTLSVQVSLDGRGWLSGELPIVGEVQPRADSLGGGCELVCGIGAPRAAQAAVPWLPLLGLALLARRLRSRPGTR